MTNQKIIYFTVNNLEIALRRVFKTFSGSSVNNFSKNNSYDLSLLFKANFKNYKRIQKWIYDFSED